MAQATALVSRVVHTLVANNNAACNAEPAEVSRSFLFRYGLGQMEAYFFDVY